MPELPEVETVARGLREAVVGRTVTEVDLVRASIVRHPAPEAFTAGLAAARIEAVERRGKYLLCRLDTGDDLVMHLGMTGVVEVCAGDAPLRPHTHLRLRLDDGRELRFADVRRFGRVLLGHRDTLVAHRVMPALGVEPLAETFTAESLDAVLRRTTRMLKAALLDQRGIAGLGNIYADEICFRAGVRPTRRCHRLSRAQRAALHAATVSVLGEAVANRGTTFDDYRDASGRPGGHRPALHVYGRAGLPCTRCGAPLRRTVVGGRTTVYCASCQR